MRSDRSAWLDVLWVESWLLALRPVMVLAVVLALADAAVIASQPDVYQARVFPRISMPGADLTITVEHVGELTEATYCPGVELTWPNGTHTTRVPDCPPWDEYRRQQRLADACEEDVIVCPAGFDCYRPECRAPRYELQRRWTFSTRQLRVGFGPGDHHIGVRFLLPNNKHVDRLAPFMVAGSEDK